MRLVATAPLMAPPEFRSLAREVLLALSRVRFVSVSSLMAFAGPSGLTEDLLEKWAAAGLIHIGIVRADPLQEVEVRYAALAPAGARALAHASGVHCDSISRARLRRSSQKRAHDLAVGETALTALTLERSGVLDLQALETDEKRIATSVVVTAPGEAPKRLALHADAYALVKTQGQHAAMLIEVDRSTISTQKMAEKYEGYLAWKKEGGPERDFAVKAFRVLTVVPDRRRLEKLHDAALSANRGRRSGFLLFAEMNDISPREPSKLFEPIALPLGGELRVPLFPRPSGPRDSQVTRPAGGDPPGRVEATQSSPGNLGVSDRPLAVTAPT